MSERYIINGVQLRMLIALPEKQRKELVERIIDKQFIGNSQDVKFRTGLALERDKTVVSSHPDTQSPKEQTKPLKAQREGLRPEEVNVMATSQDKTAPEDTKTLRQDPFQDAVRWYVER